MRNKLLTILIMLTMIFTLTSCKSLDYNKAKKLMEENKYDEAIKILKKNPDYKDSKEILEKEEKYQKSKLTKEITKANVDDSIKLLKELKGYRDSEKILEQYKKYLLDLDMEYREIYNAKQVAEKYMLQIDYESKMKHAIGDINHYNTIYKKDALALLGTIDFSENISSNKAATLKGLSNINPKSLGSGYIDFSDVLWRIEFRIEQAYSTVTHDEWVNAYNYAQNGGEVGLSPYIGMSKKELTYSAWGKPTKINTTQTSYGTSEQWVYKDNKYVYVDKDVVTCIQQ